MRGSGDFDVVVIGAGWAGLTPSRQLLLDSDQRIRKGVRS
jgi:hypothetical protein